MNTPNDESGFQLLMIYAILNLGRWPRLGWYWACGPSDFSANGATAFQPGATPQVSQGSRNPVGLNARPIIVAMPQSLSFVVVHVVFSTKDRAPVLVPPSGPRSHAYFATVARSAECECYLSSASRITCMLAIRLARTVTMAKLVEELKTSSSKWLKTQSPALATFAWQRGYGAFSVRPSDLDALRHYIDTQEEHHRTRTFQEEYRAFLTKYGIEYDERYVWD